MDIRYEKGLVGITELQQFKPISIESYGYLIMKGFDLCRSYC